MNKKHLFKGLFLALLIPLTVNYFLKTPESEVTFSSLFIIIAAAIYAYDEISLSTNQPDSRNKYQKTIDRLFVTLFIALSIDVLVSLWINGISL